MTLAKIAFPRALRWSGLVLAGTVIVLLTFSGAMKPIQPVVDAMQSLGFVYALFKGIGRGAHA